MIDCPDVGPVGEAVMSSPIRRHLRMAGALVLLLCACSVDGLNGLKPKLVVKPGTPTDSSGHYLLDFGTVPIGSSQSLWLIVENQGRVTMTVQPPHVPAPFATELEAAERVVVSGSMPVGFSFTPVMVGPANVTVTLTSDGGNVTVDLRGNGTNAPPPPPTPACTFKVMPTMVDFGNVAHGQTKTSGFRVENTGTGSGADCQITKLALATGTDPAFTMPGAPTVPLTLSGGDQLPLGITFAPTHTSRSFVGNVDLTVGAPGMTGTDVEVPLQGSSVESCPNPNPDGSCPQALSPIYVNDPQSLYTFDPMTNKTHQIGFFSAPGVLFQMYDIAIDSNGVLAGVNNGTIYVINPNTAACSRLFDAPDASANGLTFLPDGRLVIAGSEVDILDRTTGQVTNLVPSGTYTTSGDIVELPDGLLYWTVIDPSGANGPDDLVTIDPKTGTTHDLGSTGVTNIWGLSYASGVLYGFTKDGQVVSINSQTAQSQPMSIGGSWYGAATNPSTWQTGP